MKKNKHGLLLIIMFIVLHVFVASLIFRPSSLIMARVDEQMRTVLDKVDEIDVAGS